MAARSTEEEKKEAPSWLTWSTKMAVMPAAATLASKAGTLGFPALARLTKLANDARALRLQPIPTITTGKRSHRGQPQPGIAFTVSESHSGAGEPSVHPLTKIFVPQTAVGRCCENAVFPLKRAKGGDLVIQQSKQPCLMCVTAFSKYANAEQCTIVVQTVSHDDNTTLFFSKSGDFFPQA